MATATAQKRLVREYQNIQKSPPEYIFARPDPSNVLEWHYILTGPPSTPYAGGQYWGTLNFPADYPFAPPAIRMHTPSGRFRCSERLCLSISDFHPKSFNPAWEVSTILLGVLSFMTGEDMTTGSISAGEAERKGCAARSRWWNSTGGGSKEHQHLLQQGGAKGGISAIKAGDGGKRFREMFPELDLENLQWMEEHGIDPVTGRGVGVEPMEKTFEEKEVEAEPVVNGRRSRPGMNNTGFGAAVGDGPEMMHQGIQKSWLGRNKFYVIGAVLALYVVAARVLKDQQES